MSSINSLSFIKEYVTELREEFKSFMKDYHNESLKIWTQLAKIEERMITMKENQKKQAQWHGLVGGMVSVLITIGIAIVIWFITDHSGNTPNPPKVGGP